MSTTTIQDPLVIQGDEAISYGGNLRLIKTSYVVQMVVDWKANETNSMSFNKKSNSNAYSDALTWKHAQSDRLGQTLRWKASFIEKNLEIPQEVHQYIAGFFDGDGCVSVMLSTIEITFAQSCNEATPAVLLFIQKYYGGTLWSQKRVDRPASRTEHSLQIRQKDVSHVLSLMQPFCILKTDQLKMALACHAMVNSDEKKRLIQSLRQAKTLDAYQAVQVTRSRLCDTYLSGFFDAEGSVLGYVTDRALEFAQKQSPALLEAIKSYFGVRGYISATHLMVSAKDAIRTIANRLLPHLITKKAQVELLLQLLETPHVERGKHCLSETTDRLTHEIKRLKRL